MARAVAGVLFRAGTAYINMKTLPCLKPMSPDTMPNIEIYTTPFCGFCTRAKRLLDNKGVAYTEIDISRQPDRRQEMVNRAGGRTAVPQVFIDDRGVGGFEEMVELDLDDELDPMLGLGAEA